VDIKFITYLLKKPDKYLLVWAYIYTKFDSKKKDVSVYELIGRYGVPKATLKRVLDYGCSFSGVKMDYKWRDNSLSFSNSTKTSEIKVISKKKIINEVAIVKVEPIGVVEQIVIYMNEQWGTRYKESSKETQKVINARLREGFSIEEIKNVIIKKKNEWIGTEYEKYLRPQTVLGNKFESYLNQSESLNIHTKISNYGTKAKRSNDFNEAINEADRVDYSNL